ncbi:hypothetical protein HOD75_00180 [archaeon]|jgi:hypothetical protein|nr:hypothetical protein [Candidatus Woesearchaeota archaeon]MBT4136069.1 hypothetical protein [archaeon]MBT4241294.1 hypothetical protein [archaeon]MBT4418116.1 hypothetical protein [archaeon]
MEYARLIPKEIRELLPIARFLSPEEQTRYEEAIQEFTGKAKETLDIPQKASNLFKILFLNQIGIQTSTLPELESALENGLGLSGTYEDSREVILRSAGDSYTPNDYLAKSLADKLKLRNFKNPFIIKGLTIQPDEDSQYGLILQPTDNTEVIEVPDFHHKNNQKRFSRINSDYSIEFDEEAERTFYTRNQGLSRLCLDRYLDLVSNGEYLSGSDSDGRVVVVSAEGTEGANPTLQQHLAKLNQQADAQKQEIDKRFAQAQEVLRGQ